MSHINMDEEDFETASDSEARGPRLEESSNSDGEIESVTYGAKSDLTSPDPF